MQPGSDAGSTDIEYSLSAKHTPSAESTRADPTRTSAGTPPGTVTSGTAWTQPEVRDELEDLDVGDQIDDFDLLMSLGRGAFARVFLARQRSMQRIVALKISEDKGSEPQTLAQLDHDYIVRVFDQRVLPERRLRLLYMQYVSGGTLLGLLARVRACPPPKRNGQLLLDAVDRAIEDKGGLRPTDSSVRQHISGLSWPETVAWLGRRLADALQYAGLSCVLHLYVIQAFILVGAEDLDTRSDLYSLGVVLWELLTGRKPFDDVAPGADDGDRTTIDGLLAAREGGVSESALASLPDDCPPSLRRVLVQCLSPDPADRWSTGDELASQFDLCLDERARALVDPPPSSARLRLRPFTIPVMAAAIGIPNAVAATYNFQHNKTLIIDNLSPAAQERFSSISVVINGLVFPLGLVLIVYFCRRVLAVPHALRAGRDVSPSRLAHARADTLVAADRIVAVCLTLWLLAGIAFPVSLQIAAGSVPPGAYVHFIGSLLVCGSIAAAYPFFLVSLFTVRCIYPAYLPYGGAGARDDAMLRALGTRSIAYLTVAAAIPLVAVAGLTFVTPEEIPDIIDVVRVVCVGGVVAFVGSYWIFRLLERDLAALERVVS